MISATSRFAAVFIFGIFLSASSFYFFSIRDVEFVSVEKEEKKTTNEKYEDERLAFEYPSSLVVNAHVSPIDDRVFLIDLQFVGKTIADPIPLRIQIVPKQIKEACDVLGGQAGNTLPVGLTKVQPCFIPKMFQNEGLGMRMEMPRDNFTALLFSDRYDLVSEIVNPIIASIDWKQ